jgi:hypothetical protein
LGFWTIRFMRFIQERASKIHEIDSFLKLLILKTKIITKSPVRSYCSQANPLSLYVVFVRLPYGNLESFTDSVEHPVDTKTYLRDKNITIMSYQ